MPTLEDALNIAGKGWPVFPVHNVNPSQKLCSCGNPNCDNPGKHPMTIEGFKDATTDREIIKGWWARWPAANIGLKTGRSSGLFVLDIDKKSGGIESFEALEKNNGKIPQTLMVKTGGGGAHIYFAYPFNGDKIPCSASRVAKGVDVKGDGGYVVAPPSLHISGNRYEFLNDGTILQNAPDWLLYLIFGKTLKRTYDKVPDQIPEGKRNEIIFKLAASLRAKGLSELGIFEALKKENEIRCKPPLTEEELQGITKSAGRYPQGKIAPTEKIEDEPFDKDSVQVEAKRIMQQENIFDYFLKEYRKRHVGDELVMKAMLCVAACSQIEHSYGLHPKMSGEMGAGKSSSIIEAARLIAPEYLLESSFSAKALFYTPLKPGTIIVSDDTKPDEFTTEIIKRKISEYHKETKHTVILDKKEGGITLTIPPEVTFILTSVSDSVDEQLVDRQWVISVDKNDLTDQAYATFLLQSAKIGFENFFETFETHVCREITRRIKKNRYRIIVPFAGDIEFDAQAIKNRRSMNIFMDLICCSAVINQEKRFIEEDSKVLVITATMDDFNTALSLMGFGPSEWRYKLNKVEIMIFEEIARSPVGISQKDLAIKFHLSKGRISQILNGDGHNTTGLSSKAPIYMEDEYNKDSGIRSHIWRTTGSIPSLSSFALIRNSV